MKVSKGKMDYMCMNGREDSRTVTMQEVEEMKVDELKGPMK